MTRRDIERYVRSKTGVVTPGERDRRIESIIRYGDDQPDDRGAYTGGLRYPPGFQMGNVTDVAAPANNQANAIYLGEPEYDLTVVIVRMNVTTALSTTTWSELAICTSLDMALGSNADLILEGYTGVGATFNSTGNKDTEIAVSISAGAHVWLVWGSQAVTPFAVRGGLGDPLTSGRHQFAAATRPSTMANPTTFTASSSATLAAAVAFWW